MGTNTKIEWAHITHMINTGCSCMGLGCELCYAARETDHQVRLGRVQYCGLTVRNQRGDLRFNGVVRCLEDRIDQPLRWKKPRRIFLNSMSDTFHKAIPKGFIQRAFRMMNAARWHQFLLLTKRSARLLELNLYLPWAPNIWMGVSVENADYTFRIDHLRQTDAAIKFLSLEPLLGPLPNLDLTGIDWAIVGGESGPGCRPMNPDWVRDIRDQCQGARVPFFFKQFGHIRNNPDRRDPTAKQNGGTAKGGRTFDGRLWDEMPAVTSTALPVLPGSRASGKECR